MKIVRLISLMTLAIVLFGLSTNLFAHGSGTVPGNAMGDFMVTRHFTGTWDMVDHESQGLSLEVVEQLDGSRKAVVYWFTYGNDKKTAWFLGIGILVEDRIEFTLFDSVDVGFVQLADPDFNPVDSIGTMIIVFGGCSSGVCMQGLPPEHMNETPRVGALRRTGTSVPLHRKASSVRQTLVYDPQWSSTL